MKKKTVIISPKKARSLAVSNLSFPNAWDKKIASLEKKISLMEKKLSEMQKELKQKQDKKFTITISRRRVMANLKQLCKPLRESR